MQYRTEVSTSFARLNDWFNSKLLTLNFNKTKLVQFMAKPSSNSVTSVSYRNNAILSSTDLKFLRILIESLYPNSCLPIETLKIVYYSYFHSLLIFGIIFWGNSPFSRILVGKPEGKRPLGRPRCRWVDNIKMDLREIGWSRVDWMDMAQDRDQWRALVNTVLNLRVP
jgi:hypothetical protein